MCEWEAVIWGCGHGTRRKVKYCHQARNRPCHECYQTGNELWELSSIDRSGREFEIEDENCAMCVKNGKNRYRHPDEYPEPVLQDPKAQYSPEESMATAFLSKTSQTNKRSQHNNRFSPLSYQDNRNVRNNRESVVQSHLSYQTGSTKQYNCSRARKIKHATQAVTCSKQTKRTTAEHMELDSVV
jgi:hypothetical protein